MLTFSIICPSVEFSANRDSVEAKKTFAQPPDETHALTRTEPQTLEQFFREGPSRRHLFRFLTRLS
jgi:hypothetical protein